MSVPTVTTVPARTAGTTGWYVVRRGPEATVTTPIPATEPAYATVPSVAARTG
nr:hypothetical protein [Kribbella albertanoniae]